MSDSIRELCRWLADNPLEDTDDLLEFIQYSARLAALGEKEYLQKLLPLLERSLFSERLPEILKVRCEQGIWETEEYSGEELALSLIDAQDFYCFQKIFGSWLFYAVNPWFGDWWEACERADLDEAAAQMLRDFRHIYPIPADWLLPVIETPITQTEYAFLNTAYANVKLPVLEMVWEETFPLKLGTHSFIANQKAVERTRLPAQLLALDDGKPSEALKKMVQLHGSWETPLGMMVVDQRLNDAWEFQIFIQDENYNSLPIERVRIGEVPAIRDRVCPVYWYFDLTPFDIPTRNRLLTEPLLIHSTAGFIVKCSFGV